jgi:hypothetical protein
MVKDFSYGLRLLINNKCFPLVLLMLLSYWYWLLKFVNWNLILKFNNILVFIMVALGYCSPIKRNWIHFFSPLSKIGNNFFTKDDSLIEWLILMLSCMNPNIRLSKYYWTSTLQWTTNIIAYSIFLQIYLFDTIFSLKIKSVHNHFLSIYFFWLLVIFLVGITVYFQRLSILLKITPLTFINCRLEKSTIIL